MFLSASYEGIFNEALFKQKEGNEIHIHITLSIKNLK